MPRLSIDLTEEQHKELKMIATLKGLSIKEYVINKTLVGSKREEISSDSDIQQLEKILIPRIKEAEEGSFSTLTFSEIIQSTKDSIE